MKVTGMIKFFLAIPLVWNLLFSQALAEPLRILVFGDSLAAGYGLPEKDGFCPVLQAKLNELGLDATVINAGLSGDTSFGALGRAKETYAVPHDLVILEIGANDMLRALPPASTRDNISQLIEMSKMPLFLVGIRAMPTLGPVYGESFDSIYPDLAKKYNTGFYPFIFEPIFDKGLNEVWQYFQPDFLHPNRQGVDLIINALAPQVVAWANEVFVK